MVATSLNLSRIVPVTEDLTDGKFDLEIIRGWGMMHRVDKPFAPGVSLVAGEWAVLGNDGKLVRPSATPVPNTYLVLAGNNRYDSVTTGACTLIMASKIQARSRLFDDSVSYVVGDALTAKDLGAGEAVLTKAAGAEPVLARVIEVGPDYLEYETV